MLQQISTSDELPLTLASVKAHLVVEHDNDDDLITDQIWAAIAFAESYTGCDFTETVYDFSLSCWKQRIVLPRAPVSEVASVKYFDTSNQQQTLPTSNYFAVLPDSLNAAVWTTGTLPQVYNRPDAITVRYTAGYDSLPYQADAAIKLLVGHFYANRENEITGTITTELKLGVYRLLDQLSVNMLGA